MNSATFSVTLPAGTKFQMEVGGDLGPLETLEQDVDAVVLSYGDFMTMYRLADGREVFVLEENEINRAVGHDVYMRQFND